MGFGLDPPLSQTSGGSLEISHANQNLGSATSCGIVRIFTVNAKAEWADPYHHVATRFLPLDLQPKLVDVESAGSRQILYDERDDPCVRL